VAPLYDEAGKIIGTVDVFEDITTRKQAEKALKESEARERSRAAELQAILDAVPTPIFLGHDADGHFITGNPAAYEMLGLPPGSNCSKAVAEDERPGYKAMKHGRELTFQELPVQRATAGQMVRNFEYDLVLEDGSVRFLSANAVPLLDEAGRPRGAVAAFMDLTERQQAEEALRESHKRIVDILESISDGFFSCDQELVVTYFNRAAARILGRDCSEVLGKKLFDAFPEARGSVFEEKFGEALRGGKIMAFETYFEPESYRNWYDVRAFPYEEGLSVYFQVTTERKRAEEALQRAYDELEQRVRERTAELRVANEQLWQEIQVRQKAEAALETERQRLFAVLEHMPAYVVLLAPDYTIPYANREFIQRFGEPGPKRCHELLFSREQPCEHCLTFEALHTATPIIWEWTGPDGHVYQIHDYPFTDVDGSPLVLEMGLDITARKQAEEALARHTALVQDLYNNAPCGYHSLDRDGRIVQINDTELAWLGYTRDEVLGRLQFSELLTADSRDVFRENFPTFKERGWVRDLEYELVRKDGAVMPVLLSATVVTDEAGNYLMSRSTLFDITARRQAEEALKIERQRLVAVLEHIPAHVALLRPDRTFAFVNGEFVRRFGEPGAKRCYEVIGRETPCEECQAMAVFQTGKPVVLEWQSPDGKAFQIYDYPFTDVDGSPLVLEMGVDITARKQAEKQAVSLGRMYRMLSKVNEAIVRAPDQETLFRQVCRIMRQEGDFLLAWIGLVDRETRLIKAAAQYDLNDDYLQNITIRFDDVLEGRGPTGTAVREDRYDVCTDIASDPRLVPWREQALARGFRSSAAFPLRVGGEVVGVLTVYAERPGFFNTAEIALLESLADDLSFALHSMDREARRRQAEEALRESEERLRYLSSRLLHTQERERHRLALDLHDDLGQSLMVLKLQIRGIEKMLGREQWQIKAQCDEALAYINVVVENIRRISRDLRPSVLQDLGLPAALRLLTDEFRKYHQEGVSLQMDDLEGLFSRDDEINIYRIFQESLTNIAKHARASKVSLVVQRQEGCVSFRVEDNGLGFDVTEVLAGDATRGGLGLAALDERVRMLGGTLSIRSQVNQGATIVFTVPVPPPANPGTGRPVN
jgi:PAS domain S-box-containing protein